MTKKTWIPALALLAFAAAAGGAAAPSKIYWGNDVPRGWNGTWADELRTVPEKTAYNRTTSSLQLLELIDALRWKSDKIHVFNMYTSPLGKTCPVLVLASPRVTTPAEAAASGKTVVYLQGSIHPSEAEAKEALLVLTRDILFGKLRPLLDNLVILVCPCFNVDGNDTWGLSDGTPHILSGGANARGLNLNRDAIKLESVQDRRPGRGDARDAGILPIQAPDAGIPGDPDGIHGVRHRGELPWLPADRRLRDVRKGRPGSSVGPAGFLDVEYRGGPRVDRVAAPA